MKKSKGFILLILFVFVSIISIGCTNNNVSTNSSKNVNVTIDRKINTTKNPMQNLQYIDHGHGKRGIDY